jgi:hypothetical protein
MNGRLRLRNCGEAMPGNPFFLGPGVIAGLTARAPIGLVDPAFFPESAVHGHRRAVRDAAPTANKKATKTMIRISGKPIERKPIRPPRRILNYS